MLAVAMTKGRSVLTMLNTSVIMVMIEMTVHALVIRAICMYVGWPVLAEQHTNMVC